MEQLHRSEHGTKFHRPSNQPIRNKLVIKVTRIGGVSEEQFANDIKEFVLKHRKLFNKRVEFRVIG